MKKNIIQLGTIMGILILTVLGAVAQNAFTPQVSTDMPIECFVQNPMDFTRSRFDDFYYLYLRFQQVPSTEQVVALKKEGVTLLSYTGNHRYVAAIPFAKNTLNWSAFGIVAAAERFPSFTSDLQKKITQRQDQTTDIEVVLLFYPQVSLSKIEALLPTFQLSIIQKMDKGHSLRVQLPFQQLQIIANLPILQYIDVPAVDVQALNHENSVLHRVNVLQSNTIGGRNLEGSNVVIGIGDGGELGNHIDLNCRTTNKADGTYNAYGAHGDHVAGTLAGRGNLNPRCKGMAPNSELIVQKTLNIIYEADDYYEQDDMTLTNNSYGVGSDCSQNGTYNYSSVIIDRQLVDMPKLLHVFASGNSGSDNCDGYPNGFNTILRYYGASKNVLTVGAVNEQRRIAGLSSRGPAADGRLKPEICGVGMEVISTGRDYDYLKISGTSMAAPSVTGALALLSERYQQLHDEKPDGALLKALACNSADDLGNPGPDYEYGFGLINARRSIETLENGYYWKDSIVHASEKEYSLLIPQDLAEVKILLYWHDAEVDVEAPKTLVNNIDCRLLSPTGVTFLPWVLNPDPDHVKDAAIRSVDQLNNVEQITISTPIPGEYRFKIKGTEIPLGTASYYVVYDFIKKGVQLNYPYGKESWQAGHTELIQWDAPSDNIHPFAIDYSTDGEIWEVIADKLDPTLRSWAWEVPSTTALYANIRVRMLDTDYSSTCQEAFHILAPPPNLVAQGICEGYIQLDWDAVNYAAAYEVFSLNCGKMESIATLQGTTYLLEQAFNSNQRYWFAVRAIAPEGIKSERTVAEYCFPSEDILCPWKDGKVLYAAHKIRGRYQTQEALKSESIELVIQNIGNHIINYLDATYRVNGEEMVVESSTSSIEVEGVYKHDFAQKADLSSEGTHTIDVWITAPMDNFHENDSIIGQFKAIQLPNDPIVLPFQENFQDAVVTTYSSDYIGLLGIEEWDIKMASHAQASVSKEAEITVLELINEETAAPNDLILTLNLSNYDLDEGLYLACSHWTPSENSKIWTRGNDLEAWVEVLSLKTGFAWQTIQRLNIGKTLLDQGHNLGASFQIRFSQEQAGRLALQSLRLDTHQTMPPYLMNFDARRIDDLAFLKWQMQTLSNNAHFEVEVATDYNTDNEQGTFRMLAHIDALDQQSQYSYYDDETPKTGMRYYRLKQVSKSGEIAYSSVKALSYDTVYSPLIFYPNPFSNKLALELESDGDETAALELFNAAGQRVLYLEKNLEEGINDITLSFDTKLADGLYFLSLKSAKINRVIKITKQGR